MVSFWSSLKKTHTHTIQKTPQLPSVDPESLLGPEENGTQKEKQKVNSPLVENTWFVNKDTSKAFITQHASSLPQREVRAMNRISGVQWATTPWPRPSCVVENWSSYQGPNVYLVIGSWEVQNPPHTRKSMARGVAKMVFSIRGDWLASSSWLARKGSSFLGFQEDTRQQKMPDESKEPAVIVAIWVLAICALAIGVVAVRVLAVGVVAVCILAIGVVAVRVLAIGVVAVCASGVVSPLRCLEAKNTPQSDIVLFAISLYGVG